MKHIGAADLQGEHKTKYAMRAPLLNKEKNASKGDSANAPNQLDMPVEDKVSLREISEVSKIYSPGSVLKNSTVSGSLHIDFFARRQLSYSSTASSGSGQVSTSFVKKEEHTLSLDFNFIVDYKDSLEGGELEDFNKFFDSKEFFDLARSTEKILFEGEAALGEFSTAVDNFFDGLEGKLNISADAFNVAKETFKSEVETFVGKYDNMMGRPAFDNPEVDGNSQLSQIETIRELFNTNNDDVEMFFSDIDKLIEKSMEKFNKLTSEGNSEVKLFGKLLAKLFKKSTEQLQKVAGFKPAIGDPDKLKDITKLVEESAGSENSADLINDDD